MLQTPEQNSLAVSIALLPETKKQQILETISEDEARALLYDWPFWARPDQLAPEGDWFGFLLRSGRGAGKTRAGAEWVKQRVKQGYRRIALVGQTKGDVRDTMVEVGDSSILQVSPPWDYPDFQPSKRRLVWPNGAMAMIYSGDEPGQLRGPQHDSAWVDELAKFKYPQETWDNLEFGLRIGPAPQVFVTTTPRPTPIIKALIEDPDVIDRRVSSYANIHNLSPAYIKRVIGRYQGTRLGRQEIYGEILDDNPDALWIRDIINHVTQHDPLQRVVIGVDPPGSATGAECGIIGCGKLVDDFYVLEDASRQGTPEQWGRAVVTLYHKLMADAVIAEVNNGGDMVEHVIRTIDTTVNVVQVRATRGKYVRAEPVAAIYEQGRGHHVGEFAELEDQMCQWDPSITDSPDRLDGLVWAAHDLMLGDQKTRAGTW